MQVETQALGKETTAKAQTHKTPPGPRANLLSLLSSLLFGSPQDLLGVYMGAARYFGDAVRFPGGAWASYFFSHPDYVKHVLQDNHHNYRKQNRFNDLLKPFVGEGLLTSDGEVWRRRRRLAQPAFHRQRLALLATLMTEAVREMLTRWEPAAKSGQPIDVMVEMQRVAMTIVGRALFNTEVGEQIEDMDAERRPLWSTSITGHATDFLSPSISPRDGIVAPCG